jgi:hypothetical protein
METLPRIELRGIDSVDAVREEIRHYCRSE